KRQVAMTEDELGLKPWEPSGSNGIAIAPSNTKDGHALLLINPHTSFYFRSEAQVTSDQGLNVYGASTWGQFFVYQGFNEKAGWMHTTSTLDSVDEFAETIVDQGGKLFYRYGKALRPVTVGKVTVPYKAADGSMKSRDFTVYRTHHGPIVREADGKWVAFSLMNTPIAALQQSFLRTKATDLKAFQKVAEFRANSSNNTLFADSTGQVALLMPQFVPKRDNRFDYTKPVDGSDPATDWQGLHALSEAPSVIAPANGWVANSNNWPYSAAAQFSPKIQDYPKYMDSVGENPRGLHYISLLKDRKDFTVDSLVTTAYDPYQPAFARLVPTLVTAWDKLAWDDPRKVALADQVAVLRGWDNRWSTDSVAQTLAVYWGEAMWNMGAAEAKADEVTIYDWMDGRSSADQKLKALADASAKLTADFGTWKTAWGQVNRFQRLTDDIVHPFDDAKPSIPVGFASAQWGSLASYGIRSDEGTKKRYGTYGNSFVAVVEFGPRLKARAITAGGESGDPASPHFNDQAERYSKGDLREVWFYPDQVKAHTERVYKPGE
ncbi:MAG TPA: penicillin acylase family protein, partial [Phenylobacterium sp.]|nr:penicillin acylase family protein [Phenylobacterium sp.]